MATKKKKSPERISKPQDWKKWGTTVRVSWDLYNFIKKHGEFQETFDTVLKRLLKV